MTLRTQTTDVERAPDEANLLHPVFRSLLKVASRLKSFPFRTSGTIWLGLVSLLLMMLWAGPVQANSLDLFGLGSRGSAMGSAISTSADDFSAVYYNMATMVLSEANVGIGTMISLDDVQIRLKPRPPGYDLPDRGPTSAQIPTQFRLNARSDTEDIVNTYGFFAGLITSFGLEDLRFGVTAFLPLNRFDLQQTHYPDEREQYFSNQLSFELLGERSQHQLIILGTAYRVFDWLSLGGGISFLPQNTGTNNVYLDNPTDQSNVDVTLDNEQSGRVTPHAGLLIMPNEKIRFGLAYRGENFFELDLENAVQIRGFHERDEFPIIQDLDAVVHYMPHTFVLGASYSGERAVWSMDAVYALWSRYLNHQGEPVDSFSDTLSLRLGAEYKLWSWATIRGGMGFEPSPVGEQTGRTNYVDNDRLMLSLGAGHPFVLFDDYEVEVSWHVQYQRLIPRDINKEPLSEYPPCEEDVETICDEIPDDETDPSTGERVAEYQGLQTGNPGFPGFVSSGHLFSAGVDVRWDF